MTFLWIRSLKGLKGLRTETATYAVCDFSWQINDQNQNQKNSANLWECSAVCKAYTVDLRRFVYEYVKKQRYFPLKFAKFLRTRFFTEHLQ